MRTTERIDRDVQRENRQLRQAFETLLEELESGGPPDTQRVRERMPDKGKDGINPPWEREGMDKDEWLEEKRGPPDHAGPPEHAQGNSTDE